MVTERQHAELGASSARRWMNCAGSVRLCRAVPEPSQSEYAQEGSVAHMLAELCLKVGDDASRWINVLHGDGSKLVVTQEMAEAVQVYLDYVRDRMAGGGELLIETRFDLAPLNPPSPMYGTSDACGVLREGDPQLEVIDYKHGAGVVVDPAWNEQLMYYALGAVLTLGRKVRSIRATIVQPRAGHSGGPIRSWDFGWDELVAFKRQLLEAARATEDPNALLAVGDWCRFCPALPVCPAQARNAVAVAWTEFATVPYEPPAPETLTDDQLRLVLLQAENIETWLRSVRTYVQGVKERGEPRFPDWKLVLKRAVRKWVSEDAFRTWAAKAGLSEDNITDRTVRSPAQIEVMAKRFGVVFPNDLVVKQSSGYNLVPEGDPRESVVFHPGDDFAALPTPKEG